MLILLAGLLGGCGQSKEARIVGRAVSDYYIGNYERASAKLQPLAKKTNEDFVLNNVRLGSVALVDYDLDLAEAAFLRAYEVINSVGVNDGGRTLGAVLVSENLKVWKGEPFERAMANFYLGLIYYMRQDYGNARAAFENALFKLRDYEGNDKSDKYREQESNFAIASVMLGKCWQKLGREDLARANFDRAAELRPKLRALADEKCNAESNVLLVVDFGYGPQKITDFDGSIVGFVPSPAQAGGIPAPVVRINGRPADLAGLNVPPIDLLAMAQDRQWQSIDTIRAVKSALGTGLIVAGAYQGLKDKPQPKEALILVGVGLLLKAASQADMRQWEMLPRTTFILPLRLPPGRHEITVDFPGVPGLTQTWRGLVAPSTGEATYYMRMQRWYSGPFDWPPPRLAGQIGAHPYANIAAPPDGATVSGWAPADLAPDRGPSDP